MRPAQRSLRLSLVVLLLLPQAVAPATITVNGNDSSVVAGDGVCSLREAINNANADADTSGGDCVAGSGSDVIELTTDVTLTEIDSVTGSGPRGLPSITSDVTLEGNGHTIARDASAPDFGILDVAYYSGPLTLIDTTVSGGAAASGAGISAYYSGPLTLIGSTVSGNHANFAGGIDVRYSELNLVDSTVSDNTGGGINVFGAPATISSSTISDNSATGLGGGISAILSFGDLTLTNSTVSGNTLSGYYGGGIFSYGPFQLKLINTTLAGNSPYNVYGYSGFTATNSVLVQGDCLGSIDNGGNFSDSLGCPGAPIASGVDIDATLADNGGPTQTHALLPGSVAIDAAGACGLTVDQRGGVRDAACDSGSYEFGDSDADGVVDVLDVCPGTRIPEAAPTLSFKNNRWALTDALTTDPDRTLFDQAPPQGGAKQSFSTQDTGGCSCEQIVVAAGLGQDHLKHGCSTSALQDWIARVNP